MCGGSKKAANANGGREFDFRLADGGRGGGQCLPGDRTFTHRSCPLQATNTSPVYENKLRDIKAFFLFGVQLESFHF